MTSSLRSVQSSRRLLTSAIATFVLVSPTHAEGPPPIPREFRGAWVATVENIDWPSRPGLSTEDQQRELRDLLDIAAELHLNAIVLQVRPACDALYASNFEPWSHYLTGTMGEPPQPAYDPLTFAVEQAHVRGLELHAWFNPFRARHASAKGDVSEDHISRRHPEIVREYGKYLWLDPGEPAAIDHTLSVILDVVNNYDVDGVHLDDYFYPYPIKDDEGNKVPFPDDASWKKRAENNSLIRDDWRRQNVNGLIERMYHEVKHAKPWVKVGISPFGIWRPGNPEGIQGFDAYAELYADARKWLRAGWVDYMTPQLYWPIDSKGQSYPRLLEWWAAENELNRQLWPGNFASRLGSQGERRWDRQELLDQIQVTRDNEQATGNIHFSMKTFLLDYGGVNEKLKQLYAGPALVPASPWLGAGKPRPPALDSVPGQSTLRISARDDHARWWVVQAEQDGVWKTTIYPVEETMHLDRPDTQQVFITTISRTGVAGPKLELSAAGRP